MGIFITVEGGEGVGKSTFINNLKRRLRDELGCNVAVSREPGGTPLAEEIRDIFNKQKKSEQLLLTSELFLVSAARAQHVAYFLKPQLDSIDIVLCDRFADSTRVYQGLLGGVEKNFLEEVTRAATAGLVPHLTLLLDCPADIALQRVGKRTGTGRDLNKEEPTHYDSKDQSFHEKIRSSFLTLARENPDRIKVLNAQMDSDKIADAGFQLVSQLLKHVNPLSKNKS